MATIALDLETDTVVLPPPLCCSGIGLATVVRGMVDRGSLARVLHLSTTQRITLAQAVGYPGREA